MNTNWIRLFLVVFGAITFLPLFFAQLYMLVKPHSERTKDMLIGKGKDWRDRTHFKSALAFAWADILIILPLFVLGSIGLLKAYFYGFVIFFALGVLAVYFSILFWVLEKEYTYKAVGPIAYYTYYWGFFLYWGLFAIAFVLWELKPFSAFI